MGDVDRRTRELNSALKSDAGRSPLRWVGPLGHPRDLGPEQVGAADVAFAAALRHKPTPSRPSRGNWVLPGGCIY